MGMHKINSSPLLRQGTLETSRQNEGVSADRTDKAKAADNGQGVSAAASGDTAQISDTAHRLMELRQAVETGRVAMAALPDVREDKVELARERIKSGFYHSTEVLAKTSSGVDKVIRGLEEL